MRSRADPTARALAAVVVRLVLGLVFAAAGWWKVWVVGAAVHARTLFVVPYADSFLPAWSLWVAGTTVPFVELGRGVLLLLGWKRLLASVGLGGELILVTFGHLLHEPIFDFSVHVVPRTLLLAIMLALHGDDRWSLDAWLARRRDRAPSVRG